MRCRKLTEISPLCLDATSSFPSRWTLASSLTSPQRWPAQPWNPGVAKHEFKDWDAYRKTLLDRIGYDTGFARTIADRAKKSPKRVVFAEADHYRVLKAAEQALEEGIAQPILLGRRSVIEGLIEEHSLELDGVEVINPRSDEEFERRKAFGEEFFQLRMRHGLTAREGERLMRQRNYYGAMMVRTGLADSLISGLTRNYPSVIRPALQVIGKSDEVDKVAGMYILETKRGPMFFADTSVNVNPTAEEIASIAALTAQAVRNLRIVPRIAFAQLLQFRLSRRSGCEEDGRGCAYLEGTPSGPHCRWRDSSQLRLERRAAF